MTERKMAGEYVTVAEAAAAKGLRLVVTRDIPGPWAEAAKGILHVKGIAHVRVAQIAGGMNGELVAWTGINSAPIAIFNDEPPRAGWTEILMLAERIQPLPRLVPENERDRATMFGFCHELCGDDGYGWNRRLMTFAAREQATDAQEGAPAQDFYERMRRKYGHGGDAAHARKRIIAIFTLLAEQLQAQKRRGSPYYMGDGLSALDIYAACSMALAKPLPIELCPASPEMHAAYFERDPEILAATDPILLSHRDFIYETHLELPLRL
jgi:glutathione S-transferase